MNKVNLTGRISKDIELRKTPNNKTVLDLDLAVARERKGEDGKYPTDFIKCHVWEQKAEFLNQYAKKGSLIGISGRIETNNFVNKNGQRVYQTFITAEQVEILSQPKEKTELPEEDNSSFGSNNYGYEQEELPFY